MDKYEYLTSKEILPFNQNQMLEQAQVCIFPLGKPFKNKQK